MPLLASLASFIRRLRLPLVATHAATSSSVADNGHSGARVLPFSPTTMFTPATDGMYLVSVYVSSTNTSGGRISPDVFLSWTDDVNSWQSQQIAVSIGTGYNVTWGSTQFVVFDLAHQPIQLSTTTPYYPSVDAANVATYNLYVVVEQL